MSLISSLQLKKPRPKFTRWDSNPDLPASQVQVSDPSAVQPEKYHHHPPKSASVSWSLVPLTLTMGKLRARVLPEVIPKGHTAGLQWSRFKSPNLGGTLWGLSVFLKNVLFERERERERGSTGRGRGRGRSRLPTKQGARCGAPSQDPGVMT